MTATNFKQGYINHEKSFRDAKYENDIELSKYIWSLRRKNQTYKLNSSTLGHAAAYKGGVQQCNICIEDKLHLLKADNRTLLKKRTEIVSKYRSKQP